MSGDWHFHKECKYYPQCTERVEKEGKHEYIRFSCPALKQTLKYYPSDVHTIKN